jgi:ribosomal protein S18 acetylase RimI-like enzyme
LVTDEPAIRIAVETDADDVLALWRAAGAVPSATDDAASIRALIAFDPGALLVAEFDDVVVGSLIAGWDGWRGNMYRLAVRPECRRRGIASVLVRAGEARLRALGCRRITALVVGDHESAVGLWTSAGYEWQTAQRRYTH